MMGALPRDGELAKVVALPEPVRCYLDRRLLHPQAVACLEIDGHIRRWYGSLANLGVADEQWLDALATGLPPEVDLHLPLVQSPEGVALVFHQIRDGARRFLLLQVASDAWLDWQAEQQQAHELALRSRRQDELIRTLERASQVLAQSENELRRASHAQELVVSAISHEFGTPLTALLGHLELLAREELPESARQRLVAVRRGVGHLQTLVQGALDRSRLARKELRVQVADLSLAPLVHEVADLFGPQLADRRIHVRIEVEPWLRVRSDSLRLRQILINLLSNAVKYGAEGGEIMLAAERRASVVRLAVRDRGPGLSPEQQQQLFKPFQRLTGPSQSGAPPGHGLGLWIVRQLASALAAPVGVQSPWDAGQGSEFWIDLPASASRMPRGTGRLTGRRILVVDDDDEVRELLVALLTQQGAQVMARVGVPAGTAPQLAAQADRALIDLELGVQGSGLLAIQALRNAGFDGRIVATSANDGQPVAARAIAAGATAFIGKPFDFDRLFEMLDGNVA